MDNRARKHSAGRGTRRRRPARPTGASSLRWHRPVPEPELVLVLVLMLVRWRLPVTLLWHAPLLRVPRPPVAMRNSCAGLR